MTAPDLPSKPCCRRCGFDLDHEEHLRRKCAPPGVEHPAGVWFAASALLGRTVTTSEPYPCLCEVWAAHLGYQSCDRTCPCRGRTDPPRVGCCESPQSLRHRRNRDG